MIVLGGRVCEGSDSRMVLMLWPELEWKNSFDNFETNDKHTIRRFDIKKM